MQKTQVRSFQGYLVILVLLNFASAGNFALSCVNYELIGTVLSGYCRKNDGFYIDTSIDLNTALENIIGVFKWNTNGNYGLSCYGCKLQAFNNSVIGCLCEIPGGELLYTQADLNERIINNDGLLQFL